MEKDMKKRKKQLPKEYLQPGMTVGEDRYRVEDLIEDNDITITYKGYDSFRKKEVVIRELFPQAIVMRDYDNEYSVQCRKLSDEAAFEAMKEHMIGRAKKLIRLYPFDGIANVVTYFEELGTVYVIEEAVEGQTLKEYFFRRHSAKFTVEDIMKQMGPVMDTLQRLHAQGIVHGSVCPEYILLTSDRRVVLTQLMNPIEDIAQECLGSPKIRRDEYSPVELYLPEADRGPQIDIYEVAAIFYYYVTGRHVPAYYLRINEEEKTFRPADMITRIMAFQSDALMKGISVYAFDRYASMEEFKKALWPDDMDMESLHSQGETVKYQKKKPFWYAWEEKNRRRYYSALFAIIAIGLLILGPRLFHVGQDEKINRFYRKFLSATPYEQCEMLAGMSKHERQIYTNDYLDMDKTVSDEELAEAFVAKYYDFQLKRYVTYERMDRNRPYYEYLKIDYRNGVVYVNYLSDKTVWQEEIYTQKRSDGSYLVNRSEKDEAGNMRTEKLSVTP